LNPSAKPGASARFPEAFSEHLCADSREGRCLQVPGSTPTAIKTMPQPQAPSDGQNRGVMRAVRLHAPGDVRCEEVPVPEIQPDEVLLKVQAVGICGSDPARVMKKGTYSYPMTLGHEFSGE